MDKLSGDEIRRLRWDLGLTGAEFAKLFHVAQNTVYRWETSEPGPSELNMYKLVQPRDEAKRSKAQRQLELIGLK